MQPISSSLRATLKRRGHTVASLAQVLNTDLTPVENGEFATQENKSHIQNFITDGNIDVDHERIIRRTADLTIVNDKAEFTPDDKWSGHFYINRVIRLWRGAVTHGDVREYALGGTFMIDSADVIVERNMSMVTLTLSDFGKKLVKSFQVRPKEWADGTHINTVIGDIITLAGADYPHAPGLAPLQAANGGSRTDPDTYTLNGKFRLERGDNHGDKLKELLTRYDLDGYFNVEGRFVTQDILSTADRAEVWRFEPTTDDDPANHGGLISLRRSFSDDRLYNRVVVVGTKNEKAIVYAERRDTNPDSLTNIDRLGNRVLLEEDQNIGTQALANQKADALWKYHFKIDETVVLDVICNPALDANDVVRIIEPEWAKINKALRIKSLNVPLTTARQTLTLVNVIRS